ncbi:MAG: sensor histidine kinase [Vicingaceae bacterium]
MSVSSVDNRYKEVVIPAVIMGVATNIGLSILFFVLGAYGVVISPVISALFFVVFYFLLKKDVASSKQVSLMVAYFVVVEIFIHSYYLGWEMGFYYYMFLLPIIFLMNSNWKTWMIVFFNSSIAFFSVLLWILTYNRVPTFHTLSETVTFLNLLNLVATATVIFVIMLYFSRAINTKDEALVKANIALEHQNKEIAGQREKLEVLLKEVHHRVKNNLQIISSLLSLERGGIEDEEVQKIFNESKRRVEAIALIHQKLYQDSNFNKVDFNSYLEEILDSQKIMNPKVNYSLESDKIVLDLDAAVPLGLIVSELLTNSIKHAFKDEQAPKLVVKMNANGTEIELLVSDNGPGLSSDFTLEGSKSLGFEIITALVEQIDGKIDYCNNKEGGAQFKIYFKNTILL